MANPFIGEIQMAGFNFAIADWALCQGQLMSISQYQALFAIIGSTYGGDWRVTMGIPNLKSRVPLGDGTGPGLTSRQHGQFGGYQAVQLYKSQLPSHSHGKVNGDNPQNTAGPGSTVVPANMRIGSAGVSAFATTPIAGEYMSTSAISNTGGNSAHENRQPFLTVNFMMALDGIFPPRS